MPSMLASRVLLQERTHEVFEYLKFLKAIIDKSAQLLLPGEGGASPVSKELTHTLKANGYLLLYNVVEATMTQAIDDIHSAIRQAKMNGDLSSVDDMNESLFLKIVTTLRSGRSDFPGPIKPPSGSTIVDYWLDDYKTRVANSRNPLYSGNLDGKKILEIACEYGYNIFGEDRQLKHHSLLRTKNKRNDLAHGRISFRDCGRDIGSADLYRDSIDLIRCLRKNLLAIEAYVQERGYLKSVVSIAVAPVLQLQPA
jgi:MAE_28990/MAE_18760-like HEPN